MKFCVLLTKWPTVVIPCSLWVQFSPSTYPVLDISELAVSGRDAEVQRTAVELRGRPFDLSKDMPLRLALIRLSPRSHVLVVVKHHIASDGWSSGVFSRELASHYNWLTRGGTNPLLNCRFSTLTMPYGSENGCKVKRSKDSFPIGKKSCETYQLLNLPTDRTRPAVQSYRGARQSITLSKDLSEKLKGLSRKEGVTLFMTLLGCLSDITSSLHGAG